MHKHSHPNRRIDEEYVDSRIRCTKPFTAVGYTDGADIRIPKGTVGTVNDISFYDDRGFPVYGVKWDNGTYTLWSAAGDLDNVTFVPRDEKTGEPVA